MLERIKEEEYNKRVNKFIAISLLFGMLTISFLSFGENIYILTEEGEIIEGVTIEPEDIGLSPDDMLLIVSQENGELIIEKLIIEEEYIEEGGKLVMIENAEEHSYLQAYERSWEEVDTEGIFVEGEETLDIEQ